MCNSVCFKLTQWVCALACLQVRKAFRAEDGNTLVVADYGQLELRVLAHMANCESMKKAFKLGGDFHSRTALGMYDHIQKAIDEGAHAVPCLLCLHTRPCNLRNVLPSC